MLFDLFAGRRRAPKSPASPARRPRYLGGRTGLRHPERLETRLPLAAPEISSFYHMTVEVDMVEVSGFVNDENPGSVTIDFSGVTSGSASVDQYGYFYFRGHISELGDVTFTATDNEHLSSSENRISVYNSPPNLNYLYAYPTGNGKEVYVSGQVSDDFLVGNVVHLGGVVGGTAVVDSNGYFSTSVTATGAGAISAYATDYWNAASSTAASSIDAYAPSFSLYVAESGPNRQLTVSASVYSGMYGASGSATLGGILSGTAGVDSSGQLLVTQQVAQQGTVQVEITNVWGLSTTETFYFQSQAPQVSGLSVMHVGGGKYQVSGYVSDEFANGLTVQLGGALGSHSAVVAQGGAFSLMITGQPGLQGNMSAQVEDWWGLQSNQEYTGLV